MTRSERCSPACPAAILPGLALLACTFVPLRAAPSGDEVIFESSDLRIYRALDRDGRAILVLTNVDEEGNFPGRRNEAGGTTIVININNPPPSPAAAAPAVLYVVPAFGGLPGPFRYPDRQPFLGYGHGIGSPSRFSGLGLNASNGFGLKSAIPCERGYDCLFGPLLERP
jgi:hypothetical protein